MSNERAALDAAIEDLRRRGLLHYDSVGQVFDLHPVVRGIAAGLLGERERTRIGQNVVNYFTSQPHPLWSQATALDDVRDVLEVVRILLGMQRFEQAFEAYAGDLSTALLFNLDAEAECQALLKPFFPDGWSEPPVLTAPASLSYLCNDAALALQWDAPDHAQSLYETAIKTDLEERDILELSTKVTNIANLLDERGELARANGLYAMADALAVACADAESIFKARLSRYEMSVKIGAEALADVLWADISQRGSSWSRATYRPGGMEYFRAQDLFRRNMLDETTLDWAEQIAMEGHNRAALEGLRHLRGRWHLKHGEPTLAREIFLQASISARAGARQDLTAETYLALAQLRSGDAFDARGEAERLSEMDDGNAAMALAELWSELGDDQKATAFGLLAHQRATGDGEPFVNRADLDRARALLRHLRANVPAVPLYDAAAHPPSAWESEVRAFIHKLQAAGSVCTLSDPVARLGPPA